MVRFGDHRISINESDEWEEDNLVEALMVFKGDDLYLTHDVAILRLVKPVNFCESKTRNFHRVGRDEGLASAVYLSQK